MLYGKEELGSSFSVILTLRRLRQGDCGFGFQSERTIDLDELSLRPLTYVLQPPNDTLTPT